MCVCVCVDKVLNLDVPLVGVLTRRGQALEIAACLADEVGDPAVACARLAEVILTTR